VIGRPLWDFISDVTTAELYRQVLARTTLEEDARELPHLRVLEYPDVRMLTHGICEDCLVKMTGELAAIG